MANKVTGYAQGTDVPVDKSQAEIQKLLRDRGAARFLSGWDEDFVKIGFEIKGRMVRFNIPMPKLKDFATFTNYRNGNPYQSKRSKEAQQKAYDSEVQRRWRSLLLLLKAKFEILDFELSTFEKEFMSNIVLPDGSTVGDWIEPQIEVAYSKGRMPLALMSGNDVIEGEYVKGGKS